VDDDGTREPELLKSKSAFNGEPGKLTLKPEWRPAVKAFLAARDAGEWKPDDVIPHEWWRRKLGLPSVAEEDAMIQSQAKVYRFAYLSSMDAIKDTLAEEEQIWIRSPVAGVGYRWVPTNEQPSIVLEEFKDQVRKAGRTLGQGLGSGLNYAGLSAGEQKQATDGLALRGAVIGLFRRQLKK
jgi:hypothetical protein